VTSSLLTVEARRAAFVEAARSMIGCEWSHQARTPGVAVDCGGLVVCASAAVGITMVDEDGYSRRAWPERMLQVMGVNFSRLDIAHPSAAPIGAVLLFGIRHRSRPQHLAVWTGADTFVHSWADFRKVVESPFDPYWAERLHSIWDFREATWQAQ